MAGRRGVAAIDATRLSSARKKAHLSQAALGAEIGTTQGHIARWESGAQLPTVDQLPKLADALRVKVLDLLQPGTPRSLEILRIAVGLTQQALIDRLRADPYNIVMSRDRWRQIEQGERPIPEWELDEIAAVLGTSTEQVLRAEAGDTVQDVIVLTAEQVAALDADRRPGESRADALNRKLLG